MIALSVNLLFKDGFGNPDSRIYHLAGFLAVILILGDSFRFIPRITSFFIQDSDNVELVCFAILSATYSSTFISSLLKTLILHVPSGLK